MFTNKRKGQAPATKTIVQSNQTTLIANGVEISGEVKFCGSLEVEGVVKGNIVASSQAENAIVRVQATGRVEGDIVAPIVIINSKVQGNIFSSARLELGSNAEVTGDVHYQVIEMFQGSQVNGAMNYLSTTADERLNNQTEKNVDQAASQVKVSASK